MLWVLVFGGIALAGVVMVVCYGIWLAHKTADLWSELGMLGERAAELADLLAQVQPTPATYDDKGVALVASERRKT